MMNPKKIKRARADNALNLLLTVYKIFCIFYIHCVSLFLIFFFGSPLTLTKQFLFLNLKCIRKSSFIQIFKRLFTSDSLTTSKQLCHTNKNKPIITRFYYKYSNNIIVTYTNKILNTSMKILLKTIHSPPRVVIISLSPSSSVSIFLFRMVNG